MIKISWYYKLFRFSENISKSCQKSNLAIKINAIMYQNIFSLFFSEIAFIRIILSNNIKFNHKSSQIKIEINYCQIDIMNTTMKYQNGDYRYIITGYLLPMNLVKRSEWIS